jgi:hypothetical protein
LNTVPGSRKAGSRCVPAGSTNCGRNAKKNSATFGFRILVSAPWTKMRQSDIAAGDAAASFGPEGGLCRALELAELVIGVDRVHAADQRTAHLTLGRYDAFGSRNRFLDQAGRHDDDAVAIAQHVVAG